MSLTLHSVKHGAESPEALPNAMSQVRYDFIGVPNEIWQYGVSIHTVDKRDSCSQASLLP
jgi:hypothetical protein